LIDSSPAQLQLPRIGPLLARKGESLPSLVLVAGHRDGTGSAFGSRGLPCPARAGRPGRRSPSNGSQSGRSNAPHTPDPAPAKPTKTRLGRAIVRHPQASLVVFGPGGDQVILSAPDGRVRLWEVPHGVRQAAFRVQPANASSAFICPTPEGGRLALDKELRFCDLKIATVLRVLDPRRSGIPGPPSPP
jgi:hypothetical protein